MLSTSNAACALAFWAENEESDGTRLEVTSLEAPWRNGKTEHAGKNWKEDYCKTTQDGPEAQTWTDFEDDCDAVNQAIASKINDSGTVHICVFSAEILHRWKMPFWNTVDQTSGS